MQGRKLHNSDICVACSYFRGKAKPSLLIENLINYRNEDKERCNMLLLMLVVSFTNEMVNLTLSKELSFIVRA